MPVYHRTQRLQIFGEKPEIQKLYGSRYRMVVRCVAKNDTKAWYDDNKSQIFADFGSLYSAQMSVDGIDARTGEAYDDMVLVKNEATYTRSGEYVIIFTYETLTDSFVQETEDKVDFDLNGLKRLTRTIIAKDTVAYSSVVGTSTTGTSPVLTLAQVSEDQLEASEDGFKRIQEVWLESGQISVDSRPAPAQLAGCKYVTVRSRGTPVTPTGVLVAESETNSNGYITYEKTALQGTITGIKQTYKDVVQVEVPGTVSCTTVSVSSGGVSGTIAVPLVTPRKRKTIAATVTVEVLTTPTNTASIAYDLGSISCSVTSTNTSLTVGPGSTVTVGTTAVVSDTGYVQNFGASARIQTYPGCHLTTSSSTGEVSYITSSQPVASGNIISRDNTNSTRQTKCIGTGSTSATGYNTTGVIRRNSRPIVTDLDGNTYYEVVTWSV